MQTLELKPTSSSELPTTKIADLSLESLAASLNERQEQIQSYKREALSKIADTAQLVVEQGCYLCEVRRRAEYGEWLPWLAENCPSISERTAYRYMGAFEKVATVANLDLSKISINELYIACGILPPPEKKEPGGRQVLGESPYLVWADKFALMIKKNPTMTDDERAKLRAIIEPVLWPERFA